MNKPVPRETPDTGLILFAKVIRKRVILPLALTSLVLGWWVCLPQPLFTVPYSDVLLDRQGVLLEARIAQDEQWRFPPTQQLPQLYIKALMVFEDKRFYEHHGVDPWALARAMMQNFRAQRVVSGGSTISMQVIRLAKKNPPRTYWQKILEAAQALRLEFSYSKGEILALYAAHAPFGGNIVGLSAASWRYFGRSPQSLSWAESALLAVLPNNPNVIRPGKNQQQLKTKRDRLLSRLYANGDMTELDHSLAVDEPLPEHILALPKRAPHLLETLISKREALLDHRPSMLTTTLDGVLQTQVQAVVNLYGERLAASQVNHLAAVILNNQSGEVMAYIGNLGFSHVALSGKGIDLMHRPRSTGSILKPLLYATMLEEGEITPMQLVADVPTRFQGYSPENYDLQYRGVVRAKQALAQSLNIPAVNMLKAYGIKRFYDFLKSRGMSTLFRNADDYGLPLILGGAEGTLWEMTNLYAQLARAAQSLPSHYPNFPVRSQSEKRVLENNLGAGSAWLTLQALLEVGRPGDESHWKQYSSSRKVAWKTGTSFGYRDGWAIGTTPKYTVGVWAGNAEGTGVAGLTGTQTAAPLMFELFNLLPKTKWFAKPEYDLVATHVCKNDGYMASRYCEVEVIDLPLSSAFSTVSPFHQRIHTDAQQTYRLSTACEKVHKLTSHDWFSLPPHIAFYYQKKNSDYRPMPKWRQDCLNLMTAQSPMSFIYPGQGSQVYIPRRMGGTRSSVVSEVAHQYPASQMYWYLDDVYLGKTRQIHQMELAPDLGGHELLVVDESGNQQRTRFEVLSQ